MSKILKSVFLSVGIFAFTLALVGVVSTSKAYANTCTFDGSTDNDWNDITNWSGCSGVIPTAADDVVIPTALTVTVDTAAVAASLTFQDAVNAANGATISGSNSLTVTGATTFAATTGTAGATLAVGAGTFSTATLVITDGAAGGAHTLSVAAGSVTVTGHVSGTWTDAADVIFLSTGAGNMYFGGNFPSGGTLTTTATGTITFNGTTQNVGAYTTYNNLTVSASGTKTLLGTTTVGGILTISAGTLDTNTQTLTVTGASDITGTIDLDTGTKTFTGNVTLNSGAVWSETGAAVVVFGGNLANAATTFTASTGLHTMSGATKVMSGATTTAIPSLRITGATSNTGTLTVATLLDVADATTFTNTGTVTATTALSDVGTTGVFVNGASGTLNIGDAVDISTLTATATGNTVNYTKTGAQTVFNPGTATDYYHLGLSGSGAKSIGASTVIAGNLTITDSGTDTTATMVGNANTADKLYLTGSLQRSGTWGSTGSTLPAAHQNDTYFTAVADAAITVANGSSGSGGNATTQPVYTNTATPATTETTPATPATPADNSVVCPPGHLFRAVDGARCTSNSSSTTVFCPPGQLFSATTGERCSSVSNPSAPGASGYTFGSATVKRGSTGVGCKAWQMFFNAHGYNLATDGMCGPLTMSAAVSWQASAGLVADGLLGPMSRAKAMTQ